MADDLQGDHVGARTENGWDARSDRKLARQRTFLEAMRAGKTVVEACRIIGVSKNSYQAWRSSPKFRVAVDEARGSHLIRHAPMTFRRFRKQYFGMDTYPHQARIVDALDRAQPREIILINIWPEAGKTTTLEDWICMRLGEEPNLRITDVSASEDLCIKTLGQIKKRMTDAEQFGEYIAAYGPFHDEQQERNGKPWAQHYFTVAKAQNDQRDYSMQARAITSKVYGTRMDILLIDDVQARENLSQTEKIVATLRQTYFSRGRKIRIVIIGTRIDMGDVYEKLIEAEIVKPENHIVIPAVQADGTITCPELWGHDRGECDCAAGRHDTEEDFMAAVTKAVAAQRHLVGEKAWWASYQQQPHVNQLATFTSDMIDTAKDMHRVIEAADPGSLVAVSVDPALGGGCAITAAVHGADSFTVLDQRIDYNLARNEEIFVGIEDFVRRYYANIVIIERDALQKGILNDDRLAALAAEYGFQIVPHTSSRNKADPQWGVRSIPNSFIKKEIRIPYGDEFARTRMDPLIGQLLAWRSDVPARVLTQDAVMSLWFNWRHWQMNRASLGDGTFEGWRHAAMPFAPTAYVTASRG